MKKHNLGKTFNLVNFRKLAKPAVLFISALFIISMLSALSLPAVRASTNQPFGDTNIEAYINTAGSGQINVCRFQSSTTGTLNSLNLYCAQNTGSPMTSAVVYSDNNGAPGSLLGQGTSTPVLGSFGWLQLGGLSISVTSGTYYWLGFWISSSNSLISYANNHASTTKGMAYQFGQYTSPPTSLGTPNGYATWMASIYATYTTTTTTTTPTSSPTPNTITNNLAPSPNGWSTATNGMWYAAGGVANDVLDKSVLYNGAPTIRQDPIWSTNDNYAREVNGPWLAIKPGDHIVFSCWIKTSASSYGDTNPCSGARIGIDFYGEGGVITGTASPNGASWTPSGSWATNTYLNYVHWGTSTWTQIVMSFTVASSYSASPGYAGNQNNFYVGQWVTPTGIIPWMQVWSSTYGASDSGQAWFANAQLTITP